MFYKFLCHKLAIGLVVAGLLLPSAPGVLAQADDSNDQPVATGTELASASNHLFLPLVQTDLVNAARGADVMTNDRAMGNQTGLPPRFNPPHKYYLALGDSLAFGFQFGLYNEHYPSVPPELFVHGYVDDFNAMLRSIRPDIQTVNFGCPGETTETFIHGGCTYTALGFQLHNSYPGSQLDAAITLLRAYRGQVSPITINIGTNDLNALRTLCGSDISCYQLQGPKLLEQIAANLDTILGTLRRVAPNAEMITFTNYDVAFLIDPRFRQLTDALNTVIANTAATHSVRVADVFAAFNNAPQPATICNLTFICASGDSHPTNAGYQVIAEQLWQISEYDRLDHRNN